LAPASSWWVSLKCVSSVSIASSRTEIPRAFRSGARPDKRGSASTSAGVFGRELERVAVGLGAAARQVRVRDDSRAHT
jgi:hypothetical protein